MSRSYRIIGNLKEGEVKVFTPQYSDDNVNWQSINGATALTREGAEQLIETFVEKGNINEIVHTYKPGLKPLFG
jgi:hypothetical protein